MTPDEFRDWRHRMGLRQEDAGEALGYSRRWVQMVEAGEANITKAVELACARLEEHKEAAG